MAKKKISNYTRNELLVVLRKRYNECSKKEKTQILNEFVAVSGYHRKHASRLLNPNRKISSIAKGTKKLIYDEAVKEALIVIWEASDRICGKRLKAVLPSFIDSMENHGHIKLNTTVREKLLSISAATIDRLLKKIRSTAKRRKKRQNRKKKISKQIPVHTFADWDNPDPGYLEIDFVCHCGGSMSGSFIHTLSATDICSGWIECVPLIAREQSLVVEGLEVIRKQLPFNLKRIDSDNDSAFINETLLTYCRTKTIEFTRSRPFHKNDQARIEQKNSSVVRKFTGYDRYAGMVAGQVLAHLYQAIRLYVNYFQPSFKLENKQRHAGKIKRTYLRPATPCERILSHQTVNKSIKENL